MVDADSADLFILAQRLQHLRGVKAPARLRARTLGELQRSPSSLRVVRLADARRERESWVTLASRAVAAAGFVVFVGYGTIAASAASLPNSPFYSFKLFVEDVRVAVADANARPQILVEQADQRLAETQKLIEVGQLVQAENTVNAAEHKLETARATVAQSAHPQQVREAIDDATVRTASIAAAIRPPEMSQTDRIGGSLAPFVVPQSAAPAPALPVPDVSPRVDSSGSLSVQAPSGASQVITVPSTDLAVGATALPTATSGAGTGAPTGIFTLVETNTGSPQPNSASVPSATPTRTPAAPAATATRIPPAATPTAGQPTGVGAPAGTGFTVIPQGSR